MVKAIDRQKSKHPPNITAKLVLKNLLASSVLGQLDDPFDLSLFFSKYILFFKIEKTQHQQY